MKQLERLHAAAGRMGLSVRQLYREIECGRLGPLVKLSPRASAVPAESVDQWIESRISESLNSATPPTGAMGCGARPR